MIAKKYLVIVTIMIAALSLTAFSMPSSAIAATQASHTLTPYNSHEASGYVRASYVSQWTFHRVTKEEFASIHDGSAMKWSFVYQIDNTGNAPLDKAVLSVHVYRVMINGTWHYDSANTSLVHVINANGILSETGSQYQDLGTISPGSYSQHVLNMEYSSNVQLFTFFITVWYVPSN